MVQCPCGSDQIDAPGGLHICHLAIYIAQIFQILIPLCAGQLFLEHILRNLCVQRFVVAGMKA